MHAFAGCNTITFESLDAGISFLHIPYISREYAITGQFRILMSSGQGAHSQVVMP